MSVRLLVDTRHGEEEHEEVLRSEVPEQIAARPTTGVETYR